MRRRPHRRDAAVLAVAVGVFGASFGVLATASGLSVAKTCAMSLLVFTGASQFAAVSITAGGGSAAAAVGSGLLLAARNAAYGMAVAPILRMRGARRLLAAQLVIDESTAMAAAQPDRTDAEDAFLVTGAGIFVLWNAGTLLGALAGTALGDPQTLGLDAAFPAGFLALLAPHLRRPDGRRAALAGAAIALVLLPWAPAGVPIVAASLGVVAGLVRSP